MPDERGGRYFREARFVLLGDKGRAATHVPEARGLLGQMRDFLGIGGPPIQVQYAQLRDGTQIKAMLTNGQYQAIIESPAQIVEEEVTTCAPFWSGLVNTQYPSWASKFYPSTYQKIIRPDLIGEPIDLPIPMPDRHVGAFSGELRVVVQLLAGMEQRVPDSFEHRFLGTTGLVRVTTNPGETPRPIFWLVKFPAYGYGMLAMKYPVCTALTDEQIAAGLEYVPIPTPNAGFPSLDKMDQAIADGDVIEIMTAAHFDAIIGGNYYPPYIECGWAFSRSGHEAQNVLYALEPDYPYLMRTHRFKFSFVATEDTITCTGGKMDTGTPTTNLMAVCPRFPSGSVLYSLTSIFTLAPVVGTAPLYVYYDGDDEQVWSLDVTYTLNTDVESTPQYNECFHEFYTRNYDNSFFTMTYQLNGQPKFGAREISYVQSTGRYYPGPSSSGPGNYIEIPGIYGVGNMTRLLYDMTIWYESWTEHVTGEFEYGSLYVPPNQREGVYTLQQWKLEHPSVQHNHGYAGTPTTGERWSHSGGIVQWDTYDPHNRVSILQCPTTDDIEDYIAGGSVIPWDGVSDAVPASAGSLTAPSPSSFSQTVAEPTESESYLKYWGGGETIVASGISEDALAAWFATAGPGVEDQWIYAYMDALNNRKHILSEKINPHDPIDYTTNTTYNVDSMPGTGFHFIGIAVDKPEEA